MLKAEIMFLGWLKQHDATTETRQCFSLLKEILLVIETIVFIWHHYLNYTAYVKIHEMA